MSGQRILLAAAVVVAAVAGAVGLIMLIAPSDTGTYFAWPLGPPALAALVGGLYLVSAPVFAVAARTGAAGVRGLCAAVLAFTLPTITATALHRDLFDFSRPVAIAWVLLFVASPLTFGLLLWTGRHAPAPPDDPRLGLVARAVLGGLAVALAVLALVLWVEAEGPVPFPLAPLGARFLAAWVAFLAVAAAWPALRPARTEAEVPLLVLAAYPVGGLIAAAVRPGLLEEGAVAWVLALVAVAAAAVLIRVRGFARRAVPGARTAAITR